MDERDDGDLIIAMTWAELFALPKFIDGPVEKGVMKTGRIVGRYGMSEKDGERKCGLKSCREDHRHGFVIRLPDGGLSHVGKDCGRTEFGADRWESEKKRFSELRAKRAAGEALHVARAALLEVVQAPHVTDQTVDVRARLLLAAWDRAPHWLRERVENQASDMEPRIFGRRMQTQKEANDERFRKEKDAEKVKGDAPRRMIDYVVTVVDGLKGVRRSSRFDTVVDRVCGEAIRAARAAYDDAGATPKSLDEARTRLLKARATAAESAAALDQFMEPQNLSKLLEHKVARDRGATRIALVGDAVIVE